MEICADMKMHRPDLNIDPVVTGFFRKMYGKMIC